MSAKPKLQIAMSLFFQAQDFMETGIDALAVCIGNVHGKYPESGPNLKLDLLKVKHTLVLSEVRQYAEFASSLFYINSIHIYMYRNFAV